MPNDMITKGVEEDTLVTVVPETAAPVSSRLSSPVAAHNVYKKMQEVDAKGDAPRRAILQGMIDGNKPHNPRTLREAGLGHLTNINFGGMRADLDKRASASYELYSEVPTLIEMAMRLPDLENQMEVEYLDIISEEFTTAVKDRLEFLPMMDLAVRESDTTGIGYGLFVDEWDWIPKSYKRGTLLIEPEAHVGVNDNALYVVRDYMDATELFRVLQDEKAAHAEGWNVPEIKRVLIDTFVSGGANGETDDPYQRSIWESLQQKARNNDADYQVKEFSKVKILHFLTREVSGDMGVTHAVMAEAAPAKSESTAAGQASAAKPAAWLFRKRERFDEMGQALWLLPYNFGDGYLKSIRGVASWIAQQEDLSNRLLCKVADATMLSASIVLSPETSQDLGKLSFVQHGPFTITPPGLKVAQGSFQVQLSSLIEVRKIFDEVKQNNTGLSRIHEEVLKGQQASKKSATQIASENSKEARMENAAITHRYNMFEILYREIYRRITRAEIHDVSRTDQRPGQKAAILFVKRCTNRGVPKKFIIDSSDTIRITATRAIGLGSQSAKYDITQQMLGVSHMFDGKGKRVALREYVSARVGSSNTNRYAGMVDRNQVPSLEMSFAIVENALLSDGKTVLATVDQNQEVHTNALLSGLLGPILQAYGQNKLQDLRAGVVGLTAGLEHLTAHMDIMTEDTRYKQQLEQLQQFAKQAVQVQKTLMAAVQKQAQEQQAAQKKQQQTVAAAEGQLRGEGETAAIIKARGDVQVKAMTQDSLNRVREVKAQETMQIKKDLAESMIALKAREAEADILIKNLKAQAARQATVVQ